MTRLSEHSYNNFTISSATAANISFLVLVEWSRAGLEQVSAWENFHSVPVPVITIQFWIALHFSQSDKASQDSKVRSSECGVPIPPHYKRKTKKHCLDLYFKTFLVYVFRLSI